MAEVVHVVVGARGVDHQVDLMGVALCGKLLEVTWPDVVMRLDLAWGDPAEHRETVSLITCEACKAALAQEALEGAHG